MRFGKGWLAIFFIIMGLYLPAAAQFEHAVWDTLTTDSLQDRLTQQALAVNGYEEFHLTYAKARQGGGFNIYYRFFDIYNGVYPPTVIESDMACFAPVIASRYSDEWYDVDILFESGEDIWRAHSNSHDGLWTITNVTNSSDADLSPTVAYSGNYLHGAWITYIDGQYKIAYMRTIGDSTNIDIIWDSNLGEFGSGAQPFIAAYGSIPHIFYRGINDVNYHIHHAYKVHPDSEWTIEYVYTSNADDYTASATIDDLGDIHLAVSGNGGWGFPGNVYYTKRDHETGQWSSAELVTGQYSATNGSIFVRPGNRVYVASCGVSGNIYDGNVYLSADTTGRFSTRLLRHYLSCTQPVIADVIGEYGVLVFDSPIGSDVNDRIEIVYYGPSLQPVSADDQLPKFTDFSNCYPNPFNSSINIEFGIKQATDITIDIYDIAGRHIAEIANGRFDVGNHQITWKADGESSGVYFFRIEAGDLAETKKIVLLK